MASQDSILLTGALLGSTAALYSSGMFFAASQLSVPPLFHLPARSAVTFFDHFYHRGAATQVPMAAVSTVALLACAGLGGGPSSSARSHAVSRSSSTRYFAAAGVCVAASMAWTLTVMLPTNKRLVAIARDAAAPLSSETAQKEITALLRSWKWMNSVRAGLTFVGGALGLVALLRP